MYMEHPGVAAGNKVGGLVTLVRARYGFVQVLLNYLQKEEWNAKDENHDWVTAVRRFQGSAWTRRILMHFISHTLLHTTAKSVVRSVCRCA
jgi:hypothetical protein